MLKIIRPAILILALLGIIIIGTVYPQEPNWQPVNNVVKLKATSKYGESWEGTAFFIADNLLMTAGHCVEDANSIVLVMANGKEFQADSWYQENSWLTDVGIIDVNTPNIERRMKFADAVVGETIRVWGNPFTYFPVVTEGIISAVDIDEDFFGEKNLLLTDCPTNPGNSGSPLLNKDNEVVGVLVGGIYASDGMGFCIPAKVCQLVLAKYWAIKNLEGVE